ncbi:hypothetical protein OQA88_1154 [Cercophora sp. LCS_1]
MVNYALGWTSLLLLGNWVAPSTQVSFEKTLRADVPQLVWETGNDSTAQWLKSWDDFLPKILSSAFASAKIEAGASHTKTLQCGPRKENVNPNGIFHSRYFVTNLIPTHHRTDTKPKNWKNVLGVRVNGTLLHWMDGDDVTLRVAQLSGVELDIEMIRAAQGLCDAHTNHNGHGPNKGDCLCAEAGN